MSAQTSVRLSLEAQEALNYLRSQTGGFSVSQATNQLIIGEAKKRGWKKET